jgi:hypothetical protein
MTRQARLALGLLLALAGVTLAGLLFVRDYHTFYWSSPAAFIVLTLVSAPSAAYGSFLLGLGVAEGRQKRATPALIVGGVTASVSGLVWAAALALAFAVSGTGYWGQPAYYDYNGDYVYMGIQIRAFQLAVLFGLIAGFLIGAGLPRRATRVSHH